MRNNVRFALKLLPPRQILQFYKHLIQISCSRKEPEMSYRHHQRLRPYNIYINAILMSMALFWNIFHLPQTWYARMTSNKRIILTKSKIQSL